MLRVITVTEFSQCTGRQKVAYATGKSRFQIRRTFAISGAKIGNGDERRMELEGPAMENPPFLAIATDASNAGYHLEQTTVKQENLLSA